MNAPFQACGLLGQNGGNCNDIAGSGSAGTYGRFAFCDPASKLSFVMTQFYEATDRNAASCDFAGNATINSNAPSNTNDENSAVSSCLSNAAATFTPSSPGSSGSGSSSSPSNGAMGHATFVADLKAASVSSAAFRSSGRWGLDLRSGNPRRRYRLLHPLC